MNWEGAAAASEVISFGPYRLIPGERLLLKEGEVVNVGNRALDILVALTETAGDVVSQSKASSPCGRALIFDAEIEWDAPNRTEGVLRCLVPASPPQD
jgi:hypothetical protein